MEPQPMNKTTSTNRRPTTHAALAGHLRLLAVAFITLLLAACNPFSRPSIEDFSASPDTLSESGSTDVTLSWIVDGADSVTLTSDRGLSLEVTDTNHHTLALTAETNFTLTARSFLGASTTSELNVSTTPPVEEPPGDEPPGTNPLATSRQVTNHRVTNLQRRLPARSSFSSPASRTPVVGVYLSPKARKSPTTVCSCSPRADPRATGSG